MAKKKGRNDVCEECGGRGYLMDDHGAVDCYICLGSGYADDPDKFEHLYRYENDWRN